MTGKVTLLTRGFQSCCSCCCGCQSSCCFQSCCWCCLSCCCCCCSCQSSCCFQGCCCCGVAVKAVVVVIAVVMLMSKLLLLQLLFSNQLLLLQLMLLSKLSLLMWLSNFCFCYFCYCWHGFQSSFCFYYLTGTSLSLLGSPWPDYAPKAFYTFHGRASFDQAWSSWSQSYKTIFVLNALFIRIFWLLS